MGRTGWIIAGWALCAGLAQAAPSSLEGSWTTGTLTSFDRPEELKSLIVPEGEARAYEAKYRGKPPPIPDDTVGGADSEWWETDVGLVRVRGKARSSWIVSPADGQVPYTPAAKAANKARGAAFKTRFDDPEGRPDGERCLETAAPPMFAGGYNDGFNILQTKTAVVIHTEWMNDVRIVRTDGSRHGPSSVRTRIGESIGWWEGATLVIDTRNFAPTVVRAPDGEIAADIRVIERITRLGPKALHYAFFVSQPARYAQPVYGETVFAAMSEPMFEFACHEGNYSLANVLGGGRAADRTAARAETSAAEPSSAPAREGAN